MRQCTWQNHQIYQVFSFLLNYQLRTGLQIADIGGFMSNHNFIIFINSAVLCHSLIAKSVLALCATHFFVVLESQETNPTNLSSIVISRDRRSAQFEFIYQINALFLACTCINCKIQVKWRSSLIILDNTSEQCLQQIIYNIAHIHIAFKYI